MSKVKIFKKKEISMGQFYLGEEGSCPNPECANKKLGRTRLFQTYAICDGCGLFAKKCSQKLKNCTGVQQTGESLVCKAYNRLDAKFCRWCGQTIKEPEKQTGTMKPDAPVQKLFEFNTFRLGSLPGLFIKLTSQIVFLDRLGKGALLSPCKGLVAELSLEMTPGEKHDIHGLENFLIDYREECLRFTFPINSSGGRIFYLEEKKPGRRILSRPVMVRGVEGSSAPVFCYVVEEERSGLRTVFLRRQAFDGNDLESLQDLELKKKNQEKPLEQAQIILTQRKGAVTFLVIGSHGYWEVPQETRVGKPTVFEETRYQLGRKIVVPIKGRNNFKRSSSELMGKDDEFVEIFVETIETNGQPVKKVESLGFRKESDNFSKLASYWTAIGDGFLIDQLDSILIFRGLGDIRDNLYIQDGIFVSSPPKLDDYDGENLDIRILTKDLVGWSLGDKGFKLKNVSQKLKPGNNNGEDLESGSVRVLEDALHLPFQIVDQLIFLRKNKKDSAEICSLPFQNDSIGTE